MSNKAYTNILISIDSRSTNRNYKFRKKKKNFYNILKSFFIIYYNKKFSPLFYYKREKKRKFEVILYNGVKIERGLKNLECVAHTIINTFISTFSKESKEKLKENKIIIIPNEILMRETIFNYAKYLKNLNLFHLEITLESWFHYLLSSQRQLQRQQHQQHQQMDDDLVGIVAFLL
ncbi:unnamed protein product [Rhizophagus irregularis]|nr:unnamed protein product [Rhizophagus irregularis]